MAATSELLPLEAHDVSSAPIGDGDTGDRDTGTGDTGTGPTELARIVIVPQQTSGRQSTGSRVGTANIVTRPGNLTSERETPGSGDDARPDLGTDTPRKRRPRNGHAAEAETTQNLTSYGAGAERKAATGDDEQPCGAAPAGAATRPQNEPEEERSWEPKRAELATERSWRRR